MAGYTLAEAAAHLAAAQSAYTAALANKSYEIDTGNGSRALERQPISELLDQVKFWQAEVKRLTPGARRRVIYVVPQ